MRKSVNHDAEGARDAPISESGAYRLLMDCEDVSPPAESRPKVSLQQSSKPKRNCPRCETPVTPQHQICPNCRLYFIPAAKSWNSACREAVRDMRQRDD